MTNIAHNDEVTPSCRAGSAAANEAVVTAGGPRPAVDPEPSPPAASVVVLAGRATHVPQAAVTCGIQRIVTVTRRGRQAGRPH